MHKSDIERIREALNFIPAHDRETWLRTGMGIKSEFGEDGFDVWDSWSQQDASYERRAARNVWKSIRPNGKVTVGTVFHLAKAHGWPDDGTIRVPTADELAERRRTAAARAAHDDGEIARERAQAAKWAAAVWSAACQCTAENPYLQRKNVAPVATLREIDATKLPPLIGYVPKCNDEPLNGRLLVAPITVGDRPSTLELIDGAGRKTALAGRGTKAAGYWAAQPLPDGIGAGFTLLIGEGVATVLSAREATGYLAIAALTDTNLQTVAGLMRKRYPAAALVILADLKKATGEPAPCAIEAARVAGGLVAIPKFGAERVPSATDFNDMAELFGLEAIAQIIANACRPMEETPLSERTEKAAAKNKVTVELIRASELSPEPIEWLWREYLPRGKVTVLAGAPGTGKTTIAMKIAATVSNGGRWPDDSKSPRGAVLIWSGEDDPQDTLIPRLVMAGADREHIHFISTVTDSDGQRSFDPARDMAALRAQISHIGPIHLLIIDPIVSAVAGDSHRNAEVRRSLQPLVDLAGELRCAVVGITHFTKGTAGRDPVERLTGSLAFGALARIVLITAKPQKEGEQGECPRLLLRAKSNIGPDGGGFEYHLNQGELTTNPGIVSSSVVWGRQVSGTARELLDAAENPTGSEDQTEFSEAKRYLLEVLADGPFEAKALFADANAAGHSKATIKRAKKALGIESGKSGMKGGWSWALPGTGSNLREGSQLQSLIPFEACESLRDDDEFRDHEH